jgi:hypothetical protein
MVRRVTIWSFVGGELSHLVAFKTGEGQTAGAHKQQYSVELMHSSILHTHNAVSRLCACVLVMMIHYECDGLLLAKGPCIQFALRACTHVDGYSITKSLQK